MLKLPNPWIPLCVAAGIGLLQTSSLYAQVKDVTQPGDAPRPRSRHVSVSKTCRGLEIAIR